MTVYLTTELLEWINLTLSDDKTDFIPSVIRRTIKDFMACYYPNNNGINLYDADTRHYILKLLNKHSGRMILEGNKPQNDFVLNNGYINPSFKNFLKDKDNETSCPISRISDIIYLEGRKSKSAFFETLREYYPDYDGLDIKIIYNNLSERYDEMYKIFINKN